MTKYLSGAGAAVIAGAAMLLSLGASPAQAQTPGGSYLQTCTNVRAHGDRVVATCRRSDGTWQRSALNDVDSCNGGLANMNGQLTCGRRGTAHNGDRGRRGFEGYGSSFDPRDGRHHYRHGPTGDRFDYGR